MAINWNEMADSHLKRIGGKRFDKNLTPLVATGKTIVPVIYEVKGAIDLFIMVDNGSTVGIIEDSGEIEMLLTAEVFMALMAFGNSRKK